jgi:hypothetical protein
MCGEETCAKMCGFPFERAMRTSDGRHGAQRRRPNLGRSSKLACMKAMTHFGACVLFRPFVSWFVSQAPNPYPDQSVFGSILRYQFESTGPVENPHQLYLFVSLRLLRSLVIRIGVKI